MTDVLNQNNRFNPIHEAHAIEQVLFMVQVERPLNDDELTKVRQAALKFKTNDELPAITELQGFTISIGGGSPAPIPNGFMLYKTWTDGTVEKELRVERNSVTFRTLHYTRWIDEWGQAKKYFESIIPLFSENNRITGISLNYIDKFVWPGKIEECNANYLLRPNSNYLCPHIFNAQDLWHSHTGAFIRVDNRTKRLLNVNADFLDENQPDGSIRRIVVIATVLTDMLNQLGFEPFNLSGSNVMMEIEAKLNQLHIFSKEVFSNILNEEMSKRIALID
jgi:uncharacterized protein (TIGR04255 family)